MKIIKPWSLLVNLNRERTKLNKEKPSDKEKEKWIRLTIQSI